ncbi:MAG: YcjX family protein [Rhizobiaceae bacterium]
MALLTNIADEALITLDTVAGRAASLINPELRLGVTGLSRAGKTVFITALVHNLVHGGRLPLFDAQNSGRISRAFLQHQPDDNVPRFQYEDHVAAIVEDRLWPESTRQISELRLSIEYESASGWSRLFPAGRLNLDIVDYPGEWLLDLPLLDQSFAEFSANSITLANLPERRQMAAGWLEKINDTDAVANADEMVARTLSSTFTDYLQACKEDDRALSTLPPGRFLMPGDLEGSPALTFSPLPPMNDSPSGESLYSVMERRYESYKTHIIKPFFREHITRLDRQIVLVDAMQALNAGPAALADLQRALTDIMTCFRAGRGNIFTDLFSRKIDRILIAATKADHLHHESHDRLQTIVRQVVDKAIDKARYSGATVEVLALAALRTTKEGTVRHDDEELPVIIGTPMKGETIDGEEFDGQTPTAIFPGDLPSERAGMKSMFSPDCKQAPPVRFVRFRPPEIEQTAEGIKLSLPHIRLDRALQFLLGDRLA